METNRDLEDEIQRLWDDAIVMLDADSIDEQMSTDLQTKLIACAKRAEIAGLIGGAQQLNRVAADLRAKSRSC